MLLDSDWGQKPSRLDFQINIAMCFYCNGYSQILQIPHQQQQSYSWGNAPKFLIKLWIWQIFLQSTFSFLMNHLVSIKPLCGKVSFLVKGPAYTCSPVDYTLFVRKILTLFKSITLLQHKYLGDGFLFFLTSQLDWLS